jgi:hypothetical protein
MKFSMEIEYKNTHTKFDSGKQQHWGTFKFIIYFDLSIIHLWCTPADCRALEI